LIGIRAAGGLGDAIHLRAAVLHLMRRGPVKVFTPFPQVFADLQVTIAGQIEGDGHEGLLHFAGKLQRTEDISNFAAACRRAGLGDDIPLRLGWSVKNPRLVSDILDAAGGRPIFIYQPRKVARNPSQELIKPQREAYNAFIARYADHFRIRLGQPPYVEDDRSAPCELDLFGRTSIPDALDIATVGDFFFGESCYVPMMGEAMDKNYAIMFTRRALNSTDRVANMKPSRLFHKKHLATAVFDESN
jgi:hypothetical protein